MSTRGSFIIFSKGKMKELYIHCDAYPSGAGERVIELIKEWDLDILYNCLTEEKKLADNDEAVFFSWDLIKNAMRERKKLYYIQEKPPFIMDSIMCEYGYVVDLDNRELQFYIGKLRDPHYGNRSGEASKKKRWNNQLFPCSLAASFTFDYIGSTNTDSIVTQMESAIKTDETIFYELTESVSIPAGYEQSKSCLICLISEQIRDLTLLIDKIVNTEPGNLGEIPDNDILLISRDIAEVKKKMQDIGPSR